MPLRQRADHLPVFILRKGSKGREANVAQRADCERSFRDGLVVGRLDGDDRVVLAQRQREVHNLGAERLERRLGRFQACRAVLDGLEALLGETTEKYVPRYRSSSPWVWI